MSAATEDRAGDRSAGRAAATRQALLDAARTVFTASGYADASVAEVVARAGASVGSLYHHFGGKADLYLALYEHFADNQEAQAGAAVRAARARGVDSPVPLFVAGARAYLRGCWVDRDIARLFLAGGGPPGFDLVSRKRNRDWVRKNAALLRAEDEPLGEALVLVLTTVVAEAGRETALREDEASAERLAEDVLELIGRIGGDA